MPRTRTLAPLLASLLVHGLVARGLEDVELLPDVHDAARLPEVDEVLMNVGFEDAPEVVAAVEPVGPDAPDAPIAPDAPADPVAPAPEPAAPEPVADAPSDAPSPDAPAPDLAPPPPAPEAHPERTHERVTRTRVARKVRAVRKTSGKKVAAQEPCPPAPEGIAPVGAGYWSVDRDLIDYYATHIGELMKLGAVYTHKDENGDLAGFRVGLPRCSLLRDGGLRSGDVVQDINGVRINTVFQAVGAYFKLRDEPTLQVHVERGKKRVTLSYDIEQKRRRKDVGQPGDYAAEALLRLQAREGSEPTR